MSAAVLLARIEAAGVRARVQVDGRIILKPASALAPELLAEARAHKAELLALLVAPDSALPSAPDAWPLTTCGRLAPALLEAAQRGAAAVASGPADALETAEAEAIRGEDQEAGHTARLHSAREHAAEVAGLARAGLLRPPSWGDPAALPSAGARCSCCGGARWWCEAGAPSGWRCALCHPGDHLPPAARRERRT